MTPRPHKDVTAALTPFITHALSITATGMLSTPVDVEDHHANQLLLFWVIDQMRAAEEQGAITQAELDLMKVYRLPLGGIGVCLEYNDPEQGEQFNLYPLEVALGA